MNCEQCGEPIPVEKVRKGGIKRRPRFCSVVCSNAWRREYGYFQGLSRAGNAAQAAYKQEHGHVPGYEYRKEVVAKLNQERPRRRKK